MSVTVLAVNPAPAPGADEFAPTRWHQVLHTEGTELRAADGILIVADKEGEFVALYAPGKWASARTDAAEADVAPTVIERVDDRTPIA